MRKLRVSIRLKMLLVISAVLLLSMGTYLYLAITLFTQDKLAYVYDLNASLVETISEQTNSNFSVLVRSLHLFVRDILPDERSEEQRSSATAALFAREPDILRIEIFEADADSGSISRRDAFINQTVFDELQLRTEDLEQMRKDYPLPLEALLRATSEVHVQNSSLQPKAAIVTIAYGDKSSSLIIAADFRQDSLLRIFGRSKVHETFLVDQHGRVLSHPKARLVIEHVDVSTQPLVRDALASTVKQGVKEFKAADGSVFLGAYAKVALGRLMVLTQISKEEALRAGRELIDRSITFAGIILLGAFMVSILFSRYLTAPIRRLRAAAEVVGRGDFDVNVPVKSRDEIGDLAGAFNQMASTLKQTQIQLVHSEKMAAFGQLGAGITHEVKNPMTGIIGFAQIGQQTENEEARELFKMIEAQGVRCKNILVNFLKFARAETTEMEKLDLNTVVEDAVKVFSHSLSMKKVRVKVTLGENIPTVLGNSNKLQQVLLNLAMNAQHVMPDGGQVSIATSRNHSGQAVVTFSDDGPGMPEEIANKIFEPFFTTKRAGEGTGLGLAISFGIVRDHGGIISVESELGAGTTFTIQLPEVGN
jgi:two-component system NtrC family sensor kinase